MDRTLELILKVQHGDEESKEILIRENTGLIWSVVKRFLGRGYEAEDLYQIGSIGLLKSILKFDLSFEVKFSTYAIPMIIGEIKRFLRDDGIIKVSRPLKEIAIKAKYVREELTNKKGECPTINELAKEIGICVEELVEALDASKEVESLYQVVHQGEGGTIYLIDKLEQLESPGDDMVDSLALKEVINKLDQKEQQIVMLRYFEDKTQTEVAKEIGVSQVQVSRLEKKVLKTLRKYLEVL